MEIDFLKSGSLLHVGVPVRTRYACTPPRRRQLPDPSDVPLPEGAVLRLLRRRNRSTLETQKRREGVVIFVMYFFNEPRTNLRISAGPQSPWNAMALQPARRGTPDHAAGRPLMACQPRPKAHNYRAGDRPGRCASTRPGKGISRPMPQFRKLVRDITHTPLTREGFVYPAGRDGAAYSQEGSLATPWQNTCEPNWFKTPWKWRCGTLFPPRGRHHGLNYAAIKPSFIPRSDTAARTKSIKIRRKTGTTA